MTKNLKKFTAEKKLHVGFFELSISVSDSYSFDTDMDPDPAF